MDTVLVLTDFSAAATNAARYAVRLANHLPSAKIILYHSLAKADVAPPYASEISDPWVVAMSRLNDLRALLEDFSRRTIHIEIKTSKEDLCLAVADLHRKRDIGLTVMGSTGNSNSASFAGSNIDAIVQTYHYPLLVVPPEAHYERIERAVFSCETQKTRFVPLRDNKEFIKLLHNRLSALYFQKDREEFDPEANTHQKALYQLIDAINPNHSFVHGEEFASETVGFSIKNDIQLLTLILKKPSLLQSIIAANGKTRFLELASFPILLLKPAGFREGSDFRKRIAA